MAEAPQLPSDPLTAFPQRGGGGRPTPPPSRLPRVGVVLAAGQSERLASVTGGGSKALLRLGWLLGGRDGRLLLVAVGAVLGAPLAALVAVTATSALSLGLRIAFLRRPPAT
jgi:CTP:molybdopterin cytidylyltransferase MocA